MAPRLFLAQQIAQLDVAAPLDLDPEDVEINAINLGNDAGTEGSISAAREHYSDVGPGTIRKIHDSVADAKYSGVPKSRDQLMGESDNDEDEEMDADEHPDPEAGEDTLSRTSHEGKGSIGEALKLPQTPAPTDPEPTEDLSSTLQKTRDEDRKKGKAVSRQLSLWDTLLDARIRLQKSTVAANKLPHPSALIQSAETSPSARDLLEKMLSEATALSEDIYDLQEDIMKSNESIQPSPRKKRKIQDISTLTEYRDELEQATQAVSALEHAYHPHVLQTLSKWSSKVQAVTPSALISSSRNTFSRTNRYQQTAVQLIDETLADHPKLIARSQILRSSNANDALGEHVFDDTDFYQQLLRDVIDSRGNKFGSGDGDEWMSIQRQKKASKKKVDTKASKGRKIRYEVHEKLQNFMVPVPMQGSWHEEQIDELFASLLGKGFESADEIVRESEVDGEREGMSDEVVKEGFRVF